MLCTQFGICGGCQIQDQPMADQLKNKEALVKTALDKLTPEKFHPILPSPQAIFYRNKMEYSFGDLRDLEILKRGRRPHSESDSLVDPEKNEVHLGLHPKGRFALVTPTFDCLLQSPEAQAICRITASWATDNRIPVYVRKNHEGMLRHLVIREGKNTRERLVNLFASEDCPGVEELADRLKASGIPVTTFLWTVPKGISDVAEGNVKRIFWGEGAISEMMGEVKLKVAPGSFLQTNTHAAEMMISVLKTWLNENAGAEVLLDLYCGSGAIGLNMARSFQEVVGIELNEPAVSAAAENASANGLTHTRFLHGSVEKRLQMIAAEYAGRDMIVVVDPPRAGLHPQTVAALLSAEPKHLYYVSCNPETLSLNLRALAAKYRILDVQPMDFFPHTNHVETAVRLRRR